MINAIKKLSILSLLVLTFGCKKENERVFEEEPNARQAKVIDKLYTMLTTSENGWKVTIYPKGGKGFRHWMKLKNNDRVEMVSDFNVTSATVVKESTFRISALQTPTLIFDTYNYIHLPYDPTASVSGGTTNGTGLLSDIEFFPNANLVDSLLKDLPVSKTVLIGKYNGNYTVFEKATAAEETAYKAGGLDKTRTSVFDYLKTSPYFYLVAGSGNLRIQTGINTTGKNVTLSVFEWDSVATPGPVTFAYTLNSLKLSRTLSFKGIEFDELFWDEATKSLYYLNGTTKVFLQKSATPLIPFYSQYGYLKTYALITVNVTNLPDQSPAFLQVYNTAVAGLAAVGNNAGRRLNYFTIRFGEDKTMLLSAFYNNSAGSNFTATFTYNINWIDKDKVSFVYVGRDGNANTAGPGIVALTNYLEQNEFLIDWFTSSTTTASLGGFKIANNPNSYFFGALAR